MSESGSEIINGFGYVGVFMGDPERYLVGCLESVAKAGCRDLNDTDKQVVIEAVTEDA